ncbi:copper/silver/heavy metal-translocating P-type ATPase, Cd/Co/Hg/Pb/Zn-transporting [Acidovorax sp. CF316]|uniref:heavy metal translocating P-type ATPase n=1 Tax=Acidovorax sp. CF316 TaxID=1144317 RepID=UPI00026BE7DA|nr:heavy metal translocating P-type ATPase [Acidovorax sp. CF316]EJE51041.1 copper/silver/heavy metal-translocating P-type ATPase, Cd/Co/Hg/Pb/Zn-transporting [Acidovorax sp. CF316]
MTTESSSRHTAPQSPPQQPPAPVAVALPTPRASGARRAPQINVSCCAPGSSCAADAAPAKPAAAPHGHDHAKAHDHQGHDHAGHDHSTLPGWGRIGAALVAATGAELVHLLGPDTPVWHGASMVLAAVAILLAGLGIYKAGLQSLLRGQLGINALMAVAVTGAFAIGQWPEAAMVMALYALAERIEEGAVGRARNAIGSLLALSPEQAEVQQADGQWRGVPAAEVALGATLRVRPGGRVPLDGTVTTGRGAVDESSVTGESLAVDKVPGDKLYAGTLNAQAELLMQVTSAAGNTTLDRIIRAVEEAQASRAPTQRFVDRFAAIYTPAVFVLAVVVAVGAPLLLGWGWLDAIYRALVLLVIACPCALVISTPVTVVSGLAAAARRGILVKGGAWLEQARGIRAVAFDKTGTITAGKPVLVGQAQFGDDAATDVARALAGRSDHPVSKAIAAGLGDTAGADLPAVEDFTALAGRGVQGRIAGSTWQLGNRRLMQERQLWTDVVEAAAAEHEALGRSVTLLADADAVRALFAVADTLRPQAAQAVADLKALGVVPVMLTGDHAAAAQAAAREAGIAEVQASLLPEHKLAAIAALQHKHGMTAMAGDGINDAPALAKADIGFAMGAAGTDVAMETADVVIMNDDLRRVAETVRLSRRTHRVLVQNITLALGIKAVFFGLALAGQATMWMAVFADMGASLLVVANGLRMLRPEGSTATAEKTTA